MEFKIKLKRGPFLGLMFITTFVFIGGIFFGFAIYDIQDPVPNNLRPWIAVFGLFFAAAGIVLLFAYFRSLSPKECSIDMDSLTEAQINDKIEERWDKIKKQLQ